MTGIRQLEREVERLERALAKAQEALLNAKAKAAGVAVGSVVLYRGVEHRVTHIQDSFGAEKPWLRGKQKRKDGTFGTRSVHLYDDWTKP
jgi:hypothetical protein